MYWFGFAYLTEGRLILRVSRFRGLNPGSTEESITKLRMSSPAPASSTSDKVIWATASAFRMRSEEHTSELQSLTNLVCRLLLEKKKKKNNKKQNENKHNIQSN